MTSLFSGFQDFRHEFAMLEVVIEFIRLNGLVDQQILREASELLTVFGQDRFTALCRFVKNRLDLFINDGSGFFGIALRLTEITSDENAVSGGIVQNGSKPLAHTVFHDHVTCQRTRLLDIPGSPG